jgi:hypothetical protein
MSEDLQQIERLIKQSMDLGDSLFVSYASYRSRTNARCRLTKSRFSI